MRYIYIICLTLSSLFAYKYATATTQMRQYAFFMPNNAFENNTSVKDIENMRPRYDKSVYEEYYDDEDDYEDEEDYEDEYDEPINNASNTSSPSKDSAEPEIILPYVRKEIQIVKPKETAKTTAPVTQSQTAAKKTPEPKKAPELTEAVQKKLQKYTLEDISTTSETTDTSPLITAETLKQLENKSLSKMLEEIPYPDRTLPKFKQLYSIYGTELRVLYRRGELPKNKEQEETLAKANSFRRFTVE